MVMCHTEVGADYNHNHETDDRHATNFDANLMQQQQQQQHQQQSMMKLTHEPVIIAATAATQSQQQQQQQQKNVAASQNNTPYTKEPCDQTNICELENLDDLDDERLLASCTRCVTIKTCARVYDQLRDAKRQERGRRSHSVYVKAPSGQGVTLTVEYIDTGALLSVERQRTAPLVVALHGAPGSFHDFRLLIRHLTRQAVRVVAPNFPEYKATVKTKTMFRHSADEKAAYLSDFFAAVNIDRIDMLVSHSSAIYPTLLLLSSWSSANGHTCKAATDAMQQKDCCQSEKQKNGNGKTNHLFKTIQVKALALFSPAGHRLPQSMKPEWFKCGSVRVYQNRAGRAVFQAFGSGFLTIIGVPVRVDNMDHVMLSATVMRNSNCARVISQLEHLARLKLPTLLVFSENDKLIEREIFYEMTQFLGLDRATFDTYDHKGKMSFTPPPPVAAAAAAAVSGICCDDNKMPSSDSNATIVNHSKNTNDKENSQDNEKTDGSSWIRVIVFKAGGHYAYANYAPIVNEACDQLLAQVTTT